MRRRHVTSLLALVALLSAALLLYVHPVGADFDPGNDNWNGFSTFAAMPQVDTIMSLDSLDNTAETSTLIVVPGTDITSPEARSLRSFVQAGGVLVLLEDFGPGARLLPEWDIPIRIAGSPLLDPLHCYRNQMMPRAYPVDSESGEAVLLLNHSTWLTVGDPATVLAESSYFAYADKNGDGTPDEGEPRGPLPVAARVPLGDGRLLVVSDASLLLNGTLDAGDNLGWLDAQAGGPMLLYAPPGAASAHGRIMGSIQSVLGSVPGVAASAALVMTIALLYAWYNREHEHES